jgi:hypothetical protein
MKKSKEVSKEVQGQYQWFDTRKHFKLIQDNPEYMKSLSDDCRKNARE